jgi:hypothetical protein
MSKRGTPMNINEIKTGSTEDFERMRKAAKKKSFKLSDALKLEEFLSDCGYQRIHPRSNSKHGPSCNDEK